VDAASVMWGRSRARRRKRGDGSRGPRTSCCTPHAASSDPSTIAGCSYSIALSVIFLLIFAAAVALCTAGGVLMVLQPAYGSTAIGPILNMSVCSLAVPSWRYGGEDNEVIRFMETLPDEPSQVSLPAEAEVWLQQLQEEQELIEELPFVKGSVGYVTNDNKVQATVWCCWEKSRRSFKQVKVACDDTSKPTHLEALQALRKKLLEEHGASDHPIDSRAAERRAALEADGDVDAGERSQPSSAHRTAVLGDPTSVCGRVCSCGSVRAPPESNHTR
jgi:hypothetical protein